VKYLVSTVPTPEVTLFAAVSISITVSRNRFLIYYS
jgi:hypothetical protein